MKQKGCFQWHLMGLAVPANTKKYKIKMAISSCALLLFCDEDLLTQTVPGGSMTVLLSLFRLEASLRQCQVHFLTTEKY